ncbi:MAG: ABC transporter ATP-binding protein [Candidatus Omnitrophica bacterium]|nr:ABC transporter ATP-binding protein [Candidatus Omnitrophota bacterium]
MLNAANLFKEYKVGLNKLNVLKGINLTVQKGEILGIVGPSGAGKSTLLHILGGLDEPTAGKITLEGKDISMLRDKERARLRNSHFGFVFQFYHLLPEFSAIENVVLPAIIRNSEPKIKIRDRALDLLNRCGLSERLQHRPSELSGGEQQRVAVARALINMPKILFCDEPTGNLDTATGSQIKNLLWRLNKDFNMTLVVVTHDNELVNDATRVVRLKDGVILN